MKTSLLALFLSVLAFGQNPNTAVFPGAAAADTDLFVAKNRSQTTLNTTINNSITTVVLTSGSTFLAPDIITIESEILHCTTLTTNTFTLCARGQEGTSAASHTAGVAVYGLNSAWHHNQVAAEIKAIETVLVVPTTYTCSFTSVTSKACVHNLNTVNLAFTCYDAASPAQFIEPNDAKLTDANTLTFTFTASQSGKCIIQAGGSSSGSAGGINLVSYSATPAFNLGLGWLQKITLTGNVTSSSVSNPTAGVTYSFLICQDGTGSRLFVWPTSFHGAMTIGTTLSLCSLQSFIYDSNATAYFATGVGVINE